MASSLFLPPPRDTTTAATAPAAPRSRDDDGGDDEDDDSVGQKTTTLSSSVPSAERQLQRRAPSYEDRCRAAAEAASLSKEERQRRNIKLFVPRSLEDFDDGGAFPEIHVAQYPRHMGNPHLKKNKSLTSGTGVVSSSRAIVNVEIDKDGEISYDAIVKGGTNANKIVYTKHEDLIGREPEPDDIRLPTAEEEATEAARTQAALQALLSQKTALDKPSGSALANVEASRDLESKTQFIKYTPNPNAPGYNPAAAQRVIQMVPAQVDPMMPPKHKHLKAPRGPAEDPVPVLHAPASNNKLSKEERAQWNIPACISNWKNSRGFTIPLDKRLTADGRGLRDHSINSTNFATLSESLYVAERQARQEVRLRAQVQKKLALQEQEKREEDLRLLANQARMERGGAIVAGGGGGGALSALQNDHESDSSDEEGSADNNAGGRGETEEDVAARQRERLRMERKRERERELRMDKNMELKKKRLEEERDVSEKIALGVHTGSGGVGGDVDSRLYSQSGGFDSGFGAEDEYNTYSKPLFDRQGVTSSSIYRPTRGETEYNADEQYDKLKEDATSKFQPDKGFAGAEGGAGIRAGPRTAPVQFEKGERKK